MRYFDLIVIQNQCINHWFIQEKIEKILGQIQWGLRKISYICSI